MSAPPAPGALVFTSEHRAVRRARGGTLGKNDIGGRAFIEHLDAKPGRDFLQSCRESVQLEQVESLGQPVTAAAYLEYAQAQRFDPPDEVPYASAGKTQGPAEPLAGVKPAVSQHAKEREGGCAHAQNREKNRTDTSIGGACAPEAPEIREKVTKDRFSIVPQRVR